MDLDPVAGKTNPTYTALVFETHQFKKFISSTYKTQNIRNFYYLIHTLSPMFFHMAKDAIKFSKA